MPNNGQIVSLEDRVANVEDMVGASASVTHATEHVELRAALTEWKGWLGNEETRKLRERIERNAEQAYMVESITRIIDARQSPQDAQLVKIRAAQLAQLATVGGIVVTVLVCVLTAVPLASTLILVTTVAGALGGGAFFASRRSGAHPGELGASLRPPAMPPSLPPSKSKE